MNKSTPIRPVRDDSAVSTLLSARRVPALDGLRGIAAFAVVLHHAILLSPAAATSKEFDGSRWTSYLTYSPLHIMWAGTEAVLVFFVLSGLVLTWPAISPSGRFAWRAYYPSRLIRLYLPVWGAIAFTVLTIALIPRSDGGRFGPWIALHDNTYSWTSLVEDLTLAFSTAQVNTPLWSLRYEVLFSLLLPFYILAGKLWPQMWLAKLFLVVGVVGILPSIGFLEASWMFVFAIGVILAFAWSDIAATTARINNAQRSKAWWALWLITTVLLLTSSWWPNLAVHVSHESTRGLVAAGAVLAVIAAAFCAPLSRLLATRPAVWLGRVSFSLYLIHEPVIVGARYALPDAPTVVCAAISIGIALLLAHLFYKLVEKPSHRASQWTKRNFASQRVPIVTTADIGRHRASSQNDRINMSAQVVQTDEFRQ